MSMDRYTCEQTFRRLNDYIDRELSPEEMQRVRDHLEICELCAVEFEFEAEMIRTVRERVQHIAMPVGLLNRVAAALAEARLSMETADSESSI